MFVENLCGPAVLYLGFALTQVIIDLFRKAYNTAIIKSAVAVVFTTVLNMLCVRGLSIISWFVVFIPFVTMTLVTGILLYVFGLAPFTGDLKVGTQPQQPQNPAVSRDPVATPVPTQTQANTSIPTQGVSTSAHTHAHDNSDIQHDGVHKTSTTHTTKTTTVSKQTIPGALPATTNATTSMPTAVISRNGNPLGQIGSGIESVLGGLGKGVGNVLGGIGSGVGAVGTGISNAF